MTADTHDSVAAVKSNVQKIFNRKYNAAIALCYEYAGMVLNSFLQQQSRNKYWTNRTYVALDTVFSRVIAEKDVVGFFLAHSVEYGIHLEMANLGKHAALKRVTMSFLPRFEKDLQEIYG